MNITGFCQHQNTPGSGHKLCTGWTGTYTGVGVRPCDCHCHRLAGYILPADTAFCMMAGNWGRIDPNRLWQRECSAGVYRDARRLGDLLLKAKMASLEASEAERPERRATLDKVVDEIVEWIEDNSIRRERALAEVGR